MKIEISFTDDSFGGEVNKPLCYPDHPALFNASSVGEVNKPLCYLEDRQLFFK